MSRQRKYGESTTATSEAQKAAARAYYQRKKQAGEPAQKVLSITMRPDEYDASRETLTAHRLTPLQAWRRLMDELNAEPIPDGQPHGTTAPATVEDDGTDGGEE